MSFEIYPADFSTRYQLTHALSIQLTNHYNDIGKVQIVAPASDYNITALKKNNILYDTLRGTTYIFVDTKCDTTSNRITANGFTADWLLNSRVVAEKASVTTIETGVYDLINANLRGLPRVSTAEVKGLPDKFKTDDPETEDEDESAVYGGQLLDEIIPLLDHGELGHRMVWNASALSWVFEIYKGQDLTGGIHAVAFAEEHGTCTDLVINEDSSTFKNVAYVTYRLKDETEPVAVVGTATGSDRFEQWFDTSVSQEEGESVDDCRKRAVAYATMELGKYINRQSFNVVVDAAELGRLYNIGDIVSCVSLRFGVAFNARITGTKFTSDVTGEKTEIVLGDPILTALGELKLNGKY